MLSKRSIYNYLDAGDPIAALKLCDEALITRPDNLEAKAFKSLCLLRLGDSEEAIRLCLRVCAQHPTQEDVIDTLLIVLRFCQRSNDAIALIDSIWDNSTRKEDWGIIAFQFICESMNFLRQQQVAMKLFKFLGRPRYLRWILFSILLQSTHPRSSLRSLELAHLLLSKCRWMDPVQFGKAPQGNDEIKQNHALMTLHLSFSVFHLGAQYSILSLPELLMSPGVTFIDKKTKDSIKLVDTILNIKNERNDIGSLFENLRRLIVKNEAEWSDFKLFIGVAVWMFEWRRNRILKNRFKKFHSRWKHNLNMLDSDLARLRRVIAHHRAKLKSLATAEFVHSQHQLQVSGASGSFIAHTAKTPAAMNLSTDIEGLMNVVKHLERKIDAARVSSGPDTTLLENYCWPSYETLIGDVVARDQVLFEASVTGGILDPLIQASADMKDWATNYDDSGDDGSFNEEEEEDEDGGSVEEDEEIGSDEDDMSRNEQNIGSKENNHKKSNSNIYNDDDDMSIYSISSEASFLDEQDDQFVNESSSFLAEISASRDVSNNGPHPFIHKSLATQKHLHLDQPSNPREKLANSKNNFLEFTGQSKDHENSFNDFATSSAPYNINSHYNLNNKGFALSSATSALSAKIDRFILFGSSEVVTTMNNEAQAFNQTKNTNFTQNSDSTALRGNHNDDSGLKLNIKLDDEIRDDRFNKDDIGVKASFLPSISCPIFIAYWTLVSLFNNDGNDESGDLFDSNPQQSDAKDKISSNSKDNSRKRVVSLALIELHKVFLTTQAVRKSHFEHVEHVVRNQTNAGSIQKDGKVKLAATRTDHNNTSVSAPSSPNVLPLLPKKNNKLYSSGDNSAAPSSSSSMDSFVLKYAAAVDTESFVHRLRSHFDMFGHSPNIFYDLVGACSILDNVHRHSLRVKISQARMLGLSSGAPSQRDTAGSDTGSGYRRRSRGNAAEKTHSHRQDSESLNTSSQVHPKRAAQFFTNSLQLQYALVANSEVPIRTRAAIILDFMQRLLAVRKIESVSDAENQNLRTQIFDSRFFASNAIGEANAQNTLISLTASNNKKSVDKKTQNPSSIAERDKHAASIVITPPTGTAPVANRFRNVVTKISAVKSLSAEVDSSKNSLNLSNKNISVDTLNRPVIPTSLASDTLVHTIVDALIDITVQKLSKASHVRNVSDSLFSSHLGDHEELIAAAMLMETLHAETRQNSTVMRLLPVYCALGCSETAKRLWLSCRAASHAASKSLGGNTALSQALSTDGIQLENIFFCLLPSFLLSNSIKETQALCRAMTTHCKRTEASLMDSIFNVYAEETSYFMLGDIMQMRDTASNSIHKSFADIFDVAVSFTDHSTTQSASNFLNSSIRLTQRCKDAVKGPLASPSGSSASNGWCYPPLTGVLARNSSSVASVSGIMCKPFKSAAIEPFVSRAFLIRTSAYHPRYSDVPAGGFDHKDGDTYRQNNFTLQNEGYGNLHGGKNSSSLGILTNECINTVNSGYQTFIPDIPPYLDLNLNSLLRKVLIRHPVDISSTEATLQTYPAGSISKRQRLQRVLSQQSQISDPNLLKKLEKNVESMPSCVPWLEYLPCVSPLHKTLSHPEFLRIIASFMHMIACVDKRNGPDLSSAFKAHLNLASQEGIFNFASIPGMLSMHQIFGISGVTSDQQEEDEDNAALSTSSQDALEKENNKAAFSNSKSSMTGFIMQHDAENNESTLSSLPQGMKSSLHAATVSIDVLRRLFYLLAVEQPSLFCPPTLPIVTSSRSLEHWISLRKFQPNVHGPSELPSTAVLTDVSSIANVVNLMSSANNFFDFSLPNGTSAVDSAFNHVVVHEWRHRLLDLTRGVMSLPSLVAVSILKPLCLDEAVSLCRELLVASDIPSWTVDAQISNLTNSFDEGNDTAQPSTTFQINAISPAVHKLVSALLAWGAFGAFAECSGSFSLPLSIICHSIGVVSSEQSRLMSAFDVFVDTIGVHVESQRIGITPQQQRDRLKKPQRSNTKSKPVSPSDGASPSFSPPSSPSGNKNAQNSSPRSTHPACPDDFFLENLAGGIDINSLVQFVQKLHISSPNTSEPPLSNIVTCLPPSQKELFNGILDFQLRLRSCLSSIMHDIGMARSKLQFILRVLKGISLDIFDHPAVAFMPTKLSVFDPHGKETSNKNKNEGKERHESNIYNDTSPQNATSKFSVGSDPIQNNIPYSTLFSLLQKVLGHDAAPLALGQVLTNINHSVKLSVTNSILALGRKLSVLKGASMSL